MWNLLKVLLSPNIRLLVKSTLNFPGGIIKILTRNAVVRHLLHVTYLFRIMMPPSLQLTLTLLSISGISIPCNNP